MKMVQAIIREEKLEPVRNSVEALGYHGMTITEVSGRGKQGGVTLQWRAGDYRVAFLPKLKLEIVILDEDLPRVLHAITSCARSGQMGDGKIFVIPIENAIRIRTGEEGPDAI